MTVTGKSSPSSTHTHGQEPPPQERSVSAGAGRGLQVFSAGSSAQPLPPPSRGCHRPLPSRHLKRASLYGPMGSTPAGRLSFLLHSSATGQLTSPLDSKSRGWVGRGANGRQTVEQHETGALWCHAHEHRFWTTINKVQFCLSHLLRA